MIKLQFQITSRVPQKQSVRVHCASVTLKLAQTKFERNESAQINLYTLSLKDKENKRTKKDPPHFLYSEQLS